MDQLDHNLLDAWNQVFERCKADPVEARRRYERMRAGGVYDRPVRAWTVAIRSSDTRLMQGVGRRQSGVGGASQDLKRWMGGRRLAGDWAVEDAIGAQMAHEIVLDGWSLRRLGGAVEIPYPGLPIDEAATKLGKHKEALRNWMSARPGRTRAARAASARGVGYDDDTMRWQEHEPTADRPLGVRYVPQGALRRHFGMETPVVWSDYALDPGAAKGRPPARWWGTLWRSMAEGIPEGFEQVVERVPRLVPYPEKDGVKRPRFRGWWWVCPGLLSVNAGSAPSPSQGEGWDEGGANDTPRLQTSVHSQDHTPPSPRPSPWEGEGARHAGCGRLVRTLYAPLPVRTVGRYYEIQDGLKVEGLSGAWLPGVMDRWAGRRRLACEHCWKLRRVRFTDHRGWNELVSYLSGGLLYGREVEKPSDFEYERRVAYKPRRASARRGRGMGRVEPGGQTGGVAGESVG